MVEWSTISIALVGFVIGIFSNPLPVIGGIAFNFLITTLLLGYQQLAERVSQLPVFPPVVFIFLLAFSVGVFLIKFLSLIPIPYLQQMAMGLRGKN